MTEDAFNKGLKKLKKEHPDHPLMPLISRGYSLMNARYLRKALEKPEKQKQVSEKPERHRDPVIKKMARQIGWLLGERAKLSNKFHDCNSDIQRAAVSDDIQEIQKKMEVIDRQQRHYLKTGKLPEPEKEDVWKPPVDPLELARKKNSLISAISRKRRELKEMASLPADHEKKKKIPEWEKKLRTLIERRDRIISKIEEYEALHEE